MPPTSLDAGVEMQLHNAVAPSASLLLLPAVVNGLPLGGSARKGSLCKLGPGNRSRLFPPLKLHLEPELGW